MKKIVLAILVSAVALFNSYEPDINTLNTCFKESNAELLEEAICAWSEIETDESPETAASKLYSAMNLKEMLDASLEDGMCCIRCQSEKGCYVVKTKSLESGHKLYAYIEYSQHDSMLNINNMRRSITKAYASLGAEPHFSVVLQGRYDEKLSLTEMKSRATEIMKVSRACYIDGMAAEGIVSYCGFSGLLPYEDSKKIENKKININIALRRSDSYDCTYIWIGYPILTIEY